MFQLLCLPQNLNSSEVCLILALGNYSSLAFGLLSKQLKIKKGYFT